MELVYLCHPIKRPVGGIKVLYQQAALAHLMLEPKGHAACVMHPNRVTFKADWFNSSAAVRHRFFGLHWISGKPSMSKLSNQFDPERHRVVIPELWARKYGWQLARAGIPYAIFVQNGYFIDKGDPELLDEAYAGARCILTISDDTTRCVSLAFPGCRSKIQRVRYSIDSQKFSPGHQKENIITYMPRKLPDHSKKLLFFIRSHIPRDWKIVPIAGMNEAGVIDTLRRSKIFLSFSHFEGCPLPPLEAALCGNRVIGYTGQGAKEYWDPGIFDEIESGDIVAFTEKLIEAVGAEEKSGLWQSKHQTLERLAARFSAEQEKSDLEQFLLKMIP